MIPFAIAGVQMHIGALQDNVEAMRHRLNTGDAVGYHYSTRWGLLVPVG